MLGYTIIASECPHEAAEQGVFRKIFAKKNKNGAPVVTCTITCLIVQAFLVVILFSEQTYQFFYGVSVSMILIPYFFSTLYALFVCAVKKDGFEKASKASLWAFRIIGFIGFFYSIFLIYAGGLTGLMITTILFAPGMLLYLYGQKERGQAILPKAADKALAAVIVVFFAVSLVSIDADHRRPSSTSSKSSPFLCALRSYSTKTRCGGFSFRGFDVARPAPGEGVGRWSTMPAVLGLPINKNAFAQGAHTFMATNGNPNIIAFDDARRMAATRFSRIAGGRRRAGRAVLSKDACATGDFPPSRQGSYGSSAVERLRPSEGAWPIRRLALSRRRVRRTTSGSPGLRAASASSGRPSPRTASMRSAASDFFERILRIARISPARPSSFTTPTFRTNPPMRAGLPAANARSANAARKRSRKPPRLFDRQFGGDDAEPSSRSSRPALYKGEMGRSHKRAFADLGSGKDGVGGAGGIAFAFEVVEKTYRRLRCLSWWRGASSPPGSCCFPRRASSTSKRASKRACRPNTTRFPRATRP